MKHFLALLFALFATKAFAQTVPPFETNPANFLAQVQGLLADTKREDLQKLGEEFAVSWPKYSGTQQQTIIALANLMQERKMLMVPYFVKYFQVIQGYPNTKITAATFDEWTAIVPKVIANQKQGNNKLFEDYMDFSAALFGQNALYASESKTWKITANEFDLKYESGVPSIVVSETDLFAFVPGDTIMIYGTGGTYYPFETKWEGKKGETDFTRGGLDADNVNCKLSTYTVDCSKSEYTADSATLTYNPFIKTPLKGQFKDKLITNNEPETSTYPRFESYQRVVKIENLAENVKYVGGIALEGGKINGSGTQDQRAKFMIYRYDGQLGCVASATVFTIRKFDDLYSQNAEVKLYLGKDSITHPGCIFKYRMSTKDLQLQRGEAGTAKAAFIDTYHNTDIYAEAINWNVDEKEMKFKMTVAAESTPAFYESINYFDKNRLDKFQNVAEYNIITKLKNYKEQYDTFKVTTYELAKYIHPQYVEETIRRTLYKLVEDGFVYYDDVNEIVTIRRKAIQYPLYDFKRIDYDVIKVNSLKQDFNSKLNLNNYQMNVRGVDHVKLSDSSNLVIFPRNDSLDILKNRDMNFNGYFFAGRADFYGANFGFNYEAFNISMKHADTMQLNLPKGYRDEQSEEILVPVKSVVEDITGTLQIDANNNKSGNKAHDRRFPMITTTENSFVYYDDKKIQNGAYDRKKFYYRVKPFELDSLAYFNPAKVEFPGTLLSAGIFPDMDGSIGIQQDLYLGFVTDRKELPLYGGKGRYSNKISLDGSGLRGDGDIHFLASTTKANDITFFPDSLNANAQLFTQPKGLHNGVPFPRVENDSVYVHWTPKADSMVVAMKSKPFSIFENGATLTGGIVLRSKGMQGYGTVDWADALLSTDAMDFGANSMKSDSATIAIKSIDPEKFALRAAAVKADVDFDKQLGDFKAVDDAIATDLPYNQYKTSFEQFKWFMDRKKLQFLTPQGADDAVFTSTKKEQDSLRFTAKSAWYDLNTYILDIHGVPYIAVVDAHVFPDSGHVVVEPAAKMRTLNNARIVVDTITEYHRFYNATVDVFGKSDYKAQADYDFINYTGKKQTLRFDDISSWRDSSRVMRTKALANVDTAQVKFEIVPKVQFAGQARIFGDKPNVEFDGYAKVMVQNPNVVVDWFSLKNEFSTDSQYVHYDQPLNKGARSVTTGIVFYSDSSDIYTSFFNAKRSTKDKNIFTAKGVLTYDDKTKEFIAGDWNKVVEEDKRGNILKYNDASGKVYAEGKMDMGLNFGLVDVQAAGTITTDFKKNEYRTDMLMGMEFPLDKDLVEILGKDVLGSNFNAEDVDYFSDEFQRSIPEFIDPKKDEAFQTQMNKEGTFKKPSDHKYTIFFTDLKMVWDKESRSFRSVGPIGIAYIGNAAVSRLIEGAYLEIGYKKTGDFMNFYLPADDDNWYYFFYQNNNMQVASGNKEFITKLGDIDPDKRRTKTDDGKIFQYNVGSENRKNTFVTRMELLETAPKK